MDQDFGSGPLAAPGGARAGGPRVAPPASERVASEEDLRLLEHATVLGRRGWGRVHPNPLVGCVVARGGQVVGEGWHEAFGGPHAEVRALERAGEAARGATAYVSLEPCRHEGKTPACTIALVRAGVACVVYGAADPGSESGGGGEALRRAGIEVVGPVFGERAAVRENPSFFHEARDGTTYVALKLAMTLDGRIAERPGERTVITGPEATREVHRLRAGHDAVMVGAGTARVDDPLLTVREPVAMRKPPARVVLDPGASLPPDAALLRDVGSAPVVVFVRDDVPEGALERLEGSGATVHPVPGTREGLSLETVLRVCHDTGIHSVLCEGGGRLSSSLLREGRASRLYLFLAPRTAGEGGVPAFPGDLPAATWEAWEPALPPELHGRDVLLTWDRLPARTAGPERGADVRSGG